MISRAMLEPRSYFDCVTVKLFFSEGRWLASLPIISKFDKLLLSRRLGMRAIFHIQFLEIASRAYRACFRSGRCSLEASTVFFLRCLELCFGYVSLFLFLSHSHIHTHTDVHVYRYAQAHGYFP